MLPLLTTQVGRCWVDGAAFWAGLMPLELNTVPMSAESSYAFELSLPTPLPAQDARYWVIWFFWVLLALDYLHHIIR